MNISVIATNMPKNVQVHICIDLLKTRACPSKEKKKSKVRFYSKLNVNSSFLRSEKCCRSGLIFQVKMLKRVNICSNFMQTFQDETSLICLHEKSSLKAIFVRHIIN